MQVVVANILLNYQILGNKRGRPILILHGWGRTLNEWVPVGKKLSEKYRVILLDLPGFGGSSLPPKKKFDIYSYQKVVKKFIKKLGIKNVTLMGHSFGGKIGIVLTAKSNLVNRLILVNSSGVESKSLMIRVFNSLTSNMKPLIQILPEGMQGKIISAIASQDYLESGKLRESFIQTVNQDVSAEARRINCPTMIVWGENDKEVPVSSAKKLDKLIQRSVLRIIWNSGHNPHLTHPEKFLNLLREYI